MRLEFVVARAEGGWAVRRGNTVAQHYQDQERALTAAENFARAAASRGDTAVVKLDGPDGVVEKRSFAPIRG